MDSHVASCWTAGPSAFPWQYNARKARSVGSRRTLSRAAESRSGSVTDQVEIAAIGCASRSLNREGADDFWRRIFEVKYQEYILFDGIVLNDCDGQWEPASAGGNGQDFKLGHHLSFIIQ